MSKAKPIRGWRQAALELYFRLYGRRCCKCHHPIVDLKHVRLYRYHYEYNDEYMLTHTRCPRSQ